MDKIIKYQLNGQPQALKTSGERMLLWVLRTDLGLTGTKYSCGQGFCGACTVLVNNEPVRSCHYPLKNLKGKEVTTIEGLAKNGELHPLQEAFIKHNALQCGFCTPGMILTAYSFLLKNPLPSKKEILLQMEENLCRCGSYNRIIQAIQDAAQIMQGRKS
ncbi:MAG: (2Fe-2S)-binding protein [Acidobacteriota bacterium]